MDWARALTRNRDQLKAIVLTLFALARMRTGGSLFTLPRSTFAVIMAILRPAESAVRRLILIAAHSLAPSTSPRCRGADFPSPLCGAEGGRDPWLALVGVGVASASEPPKNTRAFHLFDPLKSFDPEAVWDNEPVWESGFDLAPGCASTLPAPETPLDATRLGQRLNAILRALDNLPRQARRLARWKSKRDAALKAAKPTRLSPMRPGLPPGWRQRKLHEIDDVLKECHGLAGDLLNSPNSS